MQSVNSTMPERNGTVPPKGRAPRFFPPDDRRLRKQVSHWQNKKYPEVLRLLDTFLVAEAGLEPTASGL